MGRGVWLDPLRAAMIYQHAAEQRDAEVAARLGQLAAGTTPNRTGT